MNDPWAGRDTGEHRPSAMVADGPAAREPAGGPSGGTVGSLRAASARPRPTRRLATGVPGLDAVTRGGLPVGRLHVAAGEPGAGKTILAHQIGARVIRAGGTVLYLTVHTEAHHSLLAQARTLDFFDPADVAAERFRYVSLSATVDEGGATAAREHIGRLVQNYAPTLLVLDGLHMLKLLGDDALGFHRTSCSSSRRRRR